MIEEKKENVEEVKKEEVKEEVKEEKPKNTGIIKDSKGRFVKGFSGNPAGKPPGSISLVAILKKELQRCPEGQNKKTYADMLVRRILKEAIENGSNAQIKNILNYVEGLPTFNAKIETVHPEAEFSEAVNNIDEQTRAKLLSILEESGN